MAGVDEVQMVEEALISERNMRDLRRFFCFVIASVHDYYCSWTVSDVCGCPESDMKLSLWSKPYDTFAIPEMCPCCCDRSVS